MRHLKLGPVGLKLGDSAPSEVERGLAVRVIRVGSWGGEKIDYSKLRRPGSRLQREARPELPPTPAQLQAIRKLCAEHGLERPMGLTRRTASAFISHYRP